MDKFSYVSVSVVSHGHGRMVVKLVEQLLKCNEVGEIIVTLNIPETLNLPKSNRVICIKNMHPKGFGANHNSAFSQIKFPWFVVINPDVVLLDNPFPGLIVSANAKNVAIVSPRAVGLDGTPEDCWREFPTLLSLVRKFIGGADGRYLHSPSTTPEFEVDWVSGLCMLFPSYAYKKLSGFDERYFMYYEDVDICARAWMMGFRVLACPSACLIHAAKRASRRNLRHMRWHFASMLRYLLKQSWRMKRTFKLNHD